MSRKKPADVPRLKRGRKPGSSNVAARIRTRTLTQADVKPLQVLMETMADRWNASKVATKNTERRKLQMEACQVAERVAPYLHPKLQATTLKGEADNPVKFVLDLPDCNELRKAIRGDDAAPDKQP